MTGLSSLTLADVRLLGLAGARDFLWEFETDFSVVPFQIGGERSSAFRDEAVEEICLTSGEEFLCLLLRNVAAENRFAQSEFARAFGRLRTFTNITVFGL